MKQRLASSSIAGALLLAIAACSTEPRLSPSAAPLATALPLFPPGALVIKNGTVIDGTGAAPIVAGIIVISNDRIVSVGRAADFSIPAQVKVLDAEGGTILPGIINAHVHGTASPTVRRFDFLLSGVTATCDLDSPLDTMSDFVSADATGPAARGFRAGPIITAPGGYPGIAWQSQALNYEVNDAAEAHAAVADLVRRGGDAIKIALEPGSSDASWPVLGLDEVKAIVAEAHARERLVRAHVTRSDLLDVALEAQVDVIEHIPVPQMDKADWQAAVAGSGSLKLPDAFQAQLAHMVQQHVTMVPTLTVTPLMCSMNQYNLPLDRSACGDMYLGIVRRFHELGGVIALGNDFGNSRAERGMPLSEMWLLTQAGLTPMEVIQAGTFRAAQVCGHGKELGTLETGKLADLIVVEGDPLNNLQAMGHVRIVIQGGRVVYPSE